MTIENSGLSNKYYFDLSASFSRSLKQEATFSQQTNFNRNDVRFESSYSRSSSLSLIEKALGSNLGKQVELNSGNQFEPPARTIAKNVLALVRQELREARNSGASEQQLQVIINKASEGIQKGFDEAKNILHGRFELEPRLERQIDGAFNRIQKGLERLDSRFSPNVEKIAEPRDANQNQTSSVDAEVLPVTSSVDANILSRQIELTKTRNVERTKSFELSIQTQEGDTVNLKIQKSFNKQISKEATFDDEGFTINIDRQVQREKQVSYQVSGDINEQEQAAIDALVRKIDRVSNKFYNGNVAAAFQKASRIGIDAEQLANFSLNLQSSRTLEVTKTYREVQGIPVSQQTLSPVESIGGFVADIRETADDSAITNIVPDPVHVATELFKQIAIRDERYSQLVLEQGVEVIDNVIEDVASLAEEQLAQAA